MTYTHRGRFGICPVLLSDPDGEAPSMIPRHPVLTPLLVVSEWLVAWGMWATGNYVFPIMVGPMLDKPVTIKYDWEEPPATLSKGSEEEK